MVVLVVDHLGFLLLIVEGANLIVCTHLRATRNNLDQMVANRDGLVVWMASARCLFLEEKENCRLVFFNVSNMD